MSPLDALPVSLPMAPISSEVDAVAVSKNFQQNLRNLKPENFTSDAVWRDTFALTGTLRTFYGPESICKAYKDTSESLEPSGFELDAHSAMVFRAGPAAWIQAFFNFETRGPPATVCQAIVSLVPTENGEWRIWMLRTVLEELKGQGSVDILENAQDVSLKTDSDTDFDCVVVGGGQAGLSVGGKLHALGLSYVVLDENEEVGDSWKKRYDSCKCKHAKKNSIWKC